MEALINDIRNCHIYEDCTNTWESKLDDDFNKLAEYYITEDFEKICNFNCLFYNSKLKNKIIKFLKNQNNARKILLKKINEMIVKDINILDLDSVIDYYIDSLKIS